MLPERAKLLLSAAIGGDLSPRQRRLVQRWLERSSAARHYYRQLQDDRALLKRLPPAEIPVDFSRTVLAAIAERGPIRPVQPVPAAPRRFWSMSVSWSVAAGLFLTITLGSYAFFRNRQAPAGRPMVANLGGQGGVRSSSPARPPSGAVVELHPPTIEQTGPDNPTLDEPPPHDVATAQSIPSVPPTLPLTGAPPPPPPPIGVVRGQLPVIFSPRELEQAAVRQKLLDELHRHEVAHIDLATAGSARACERLQAIFQGMGLKVYSDPLAQERVNRRLSGEFAFAIYLDAVKAEDLALVLRRFGDSDRKGDERAIVGPLQPNDAKELAGLTGRDVLGPVKSSKPSAAARAALVFAYPPLKSPIITREMRQLLDARKARPADRMGAILIVR